MEKNLDRLKRIRTVAYLCHGLGLLGLVFWVINGIIFFIGYATQSDKSPNLREMVANYGSALITAILPIVAVYAVGSVLYILLEIEENTRKPQ